MKKNYDHNVHTLKSYCSQEFFLNLENIYTIRSQNASWCLYGTRSIVYRPTGVWIVYLQQSCLEYFQNRTTTANNLNNKVHRHCHWCPELRSARNVGLPTGTESLSHLHLSLELLRLGKTLPQFGLLASASKSKCSDHVIIHSSLLIQLIAVYCSLNVELPAPAGTGKAVDIGNLIFDIGNLMDVHVIVCELALAIT